ncbi:Lipoprotein signal peptidase [Frankliniella fusca]|uniref:Lipoprotein signal peptidase n=1 Tax=Frankliniella fusca TaxID=407009 RepID=A0AAE1HPL5_9NEOP|nr:Lipoprotein signal peptidase [Frankliniella fusca]
MENFCGSKPPEGGCGSRQAQGFYPLWQPTASVFHGNRRFADCDPIAQFDRFDPRTTIGLPLEVRAVSRALDFLIPVSEALPQRGTRDSNPQPRVPTRSQNRKRPNAQSHRANGDETAVAYGLLLAMIWPMAAFAALGSYLSVAYDLSPSGPKKRNDTLDIQGYNETLSTEVPSTEAPVPVPGAPVPPDFIPTEMERVVRLASCTALISYTLGLSVGFFRKLRHLQVVFRRSDELPGKVRWKSALFVVEMMVFVVPPIGWIVKAFSEQRGLSDLELYSFITMLVTIEKFMMLHLVTRVGAGFDYVTGRLAALRTAQGKTREKRPSRPGFKSPVIDEILNMRRLHLNFCGVLERIERAYEVQWHECQLQCQKSATLTHLGFPLSAHEIVCFLLAEFITTVISLYMLARSLYQSTMQLMSLIALMFLVLVTQVTVLLFATCRRISLKGNATTAVVTKLLNDKQLGEEEVHELMTFSMQLKHLEVSVSAYDAVTMDFSTLQAVSPHDQFYTLRNSRSRVDQFHFNLFQLVANVAMHIVVLTQFNLSG